MPRMKKDHKFITEDTEIVIDEEWFAIIAEELMSELFLEYVNNLYGTSVIELKPEAIARRTKAKEDLIEKRKKEQENSQIAESQQAKQE